MALENWPIGKIVPYPNNPRKNDKAVAAVAESIRQCGYIAPIVVDEEGVVLAGHTRLKALKELDYETADVLVMRDLSPEQKRKYRLLDNKTGELAGWDTGLLAEELNGLNFEGLNLDWGLDEGHLGPEPSDPAVPDAPAIPTTKLGDVWQLGWHRLMCGDSLSSENVQTLMGGYRPTCF